MTTDATTSAVPPILDWATPLLTLVLGAWIARSTKRGDARLVAGKRLAQMRRMVWAKYQSEDDWVDLQVYLGELRVELREAGVPESLVQYLLHQANEWWRKVEPSGDPDIGLWIQGEEPDLRGAEARVLAWLGKPWRLVARWKAWRQHRALAKDTPSAKK